MAAWDVMILAAAAMAQAAGGTDARPTAAPMAQAPCTAPAPLPATYAGWGAATPLVASDDAATAAALVPGKAARVTLGDAAAVHWAIPPGHTPAAGSRGGIVAMQVPAAGRYRVALGAGAWIDMVRGATEVRSVAHAHGPACTPVRKIVDFHLTPGRYLIQLSGTAAPMIDVLALAVTG